MKRLCTSLLVLLACTLAHAGQSTALLQPGETLTYRVGWGMFGHVGEIKIGARHDRVEELDCIRVDTTTRTTGFARTFFKFDGQATCYFDATDGLLLQATAETEQKNKNTRADIAFNYPKQEAIYTDYINPSRSKVVPLPQDSMPMDLITALIQSRIWALDLGQSREALVLFDDEFYSLVITAEREETISTPTGPRKAVLLVPRMQGTPKGLFRRGGEIHVWVSTDEARLPLRFEVKLKVGTAYAILDDYEAPSSITPTPPIHATKVTAHTAKNNGLTPRAGPHDTNNNKSALTSF